MHWKQRIEYNIEHHNTEPIQGGLHIGYMESHSMDKSANHHKEEAYTHGILQTPAVDTCTRKVPYRQHR